MRRVRHNLADARMGFDQIGIALERLLDRAKCRIKVAADQQQLTEPERLPGVVVVQRHRAARSRKRKLEVAGCRQQIALAGMRIHQLRIA